jgi:hypothetical protein
VKSDIHGIKPIVADAMSMAITNGKACFAI